MALQLWPFQSRQAGIRGSKVWWGKKKRVRYVRDVELLLYESQLETRVLQCRKEMAEYKVVHGKQWLESGYSQVPLMPDLWDTKLNCLTENLKQWEVLSCNARLNLGINCYNILLEVHSSPKPIKLVEGKPIALKCKGMGIFSGSEIPLGSDCQKLGG